MEINYEPIDQPPVWILGKAAFCAPQSAGETIAGLWRRANEEFAAIAPLILRGETGAPLGLWGAMLDENLAFHRWGPGGGWYLAGCQAGADTAAPPGWTRWSMPGYRALCARVPEAQNAQAFKETLDRLHSMGLALCGAVQERYDPSLPGEVWLYFPVEKI